MRAVLIDGGVPFDKEEDSDNDHPRYHLTREAVTAIAVFCTLPMPQDGNADVLAR